MSVTPIRFRVVLKKLGLFFLILLLFFGGIHAFLYYKANTLFKAFVEQMSDGSYTASTQKLRFGYFPFRLNGMGVKFYPLDTTEMQNQYIITSDTLQLRLTSITPLLFYNALQVSQVRVVNPMVNLISYGTKDAEKNVSFHIPIQEIQNGLLKSLDLLQVDKCEIINGGFSLMRNDEKEKFAVNHIFISIDSLLAARKGNLLENGDTVNAHFTLRLNNPDIEIPDSNFLVEVDKFLIDTRKNIFSIDELRFSRKKQNDAYDTVKLSSITLKGLDWQSFLNNGIIILDSVNVKNGLAQIDLTDRFIFQKKQAKGEKKYMKVDVPLDIHHVNIAQISYKLRAQRKTGPFTILLDGDSLQMSSFTMIDNVAKPINIGSLSLNVRNYYDQDDKKTYVSGFDKLNIKDNDLNISNYRLIPLRRDGFSANNRIEIPFLTLYNYDLGGLLLGTLEADRLELNSPNIVLDILHQRGSKPGGRGLFNMLHRLQPTLDIRELAINNATITLQPQNDLANSITLSQLSTELNVEKLLESASLNDLMLVAEDIVSDGFFMTGPRFEFKITNAKIAKGTEELKIGRLEGILSKTLELDLDSVTIVAKRGEMLIPVDGRLYLEKVSIGGGDVFVIGNAKDNKSNDDDKKPAPDVFIDNIITGPLKVSYLNPNGAPLALQSVIVDLKGLEVGREKVQWASVFLSGNVLVANAGNNNIRVEGWQGNFPGNLSLKNVKIWPSDQNVFGVSTDIPQMKLTNNIQSINWNPNGISNLELFNPIIRWNLIPVQKTGESDSAKQPLPFFLNKITLHNPDIKGDRLTRDGKTRSISLNNGRFVLDSLDFYHSNHEQISLGRVKANLIKPVVEIDSIWTIQPKNLNFIGSNFIIPKGGKPSGFLDSLEIEGVGNIPVFKNPNQKLTIEKGGIAGWMYPLPPGNAWNEFLNGPDWWLSGMNYELKTLNNKLNIYNAKAFRENQTIKFDSMTLLPHLDRDSFWATKPFESDYITLKLGETEIQNFKPLVYFLKDSSAHIKSIRTKVMQLSAARDKRFPTDTVSYRPLLANQIRQIPFNLKLDTFILENGEITYNEISDKFKQEGYLTLNNLSGKVYGINSRPSTLEDSFLIDVTGKFMNTAPMHLRFAQPYLDTLQGFTFDVRLGRWPMSALNPLLGPLNSVQFRRGMADSLWLHAVGNELRAYGFMGFEYHKMRIGVLKNGVQNKYFLSGIVNGAANLILVNNNNGNTTPFYVERKQDKAIFNYWAKIMASGMLGNIGVPGKKKAARKAIRKQDLPVQIPGR